MKEYRSSIRSKKMIRTAFIELLSEKDISKITVVDIVERADLSRNTFYAHYQDVYAVLEEIENDYINEMNIYLDDAIRNNEFKDPLTLLKRLQKFVEQDENNIRLLLATKNAMIFGEKLKRIFIARVVEELGSIKLKDEQGFLIFLECMTSGFFSLYQKSLMGEGSLRLDDITEGINRAFVYGVNQYL